MTVWPDRSGGSEEYHLHSPNVAWLGAEVDVARNVPAGLQQLLLSPDFAGNRRPVGEPEPSRQVRVGLRQGRHGVAGRGQVVVDRSPDVVIRRGIDRRVARNAVRQVLGDLLKVRTPLQEAGLKERDDLERKEYGWAW